MKILDTNIIIRFFINYVPESHKIAYDIITAENVFVASEVIAEVIYILTKYYEIDRKQTGEKLARFMELDNVSVENLSVVRKSIELFVQTSLDYVDCLLCAYHTECGYEVCTFDKKLKKLIERVDSSARVSGGDQYGI